MSWVWNVVLSFSDDEFWDESDSPSESCRSLDAINGWLADKGKLVSLTAPTFAKNVGVGIDANLFGGGFKRLGIDEFIEVVRAQNWKNRSLVQLWVKGGEAGMSSDPFQAVDLRRRPSKRKAQRSPSNSRSKNGKKS